MIVVAMYLRFSRQSGRVLSLFNASPVDAALLVEQEVGAIARPVGSFEVRLCNISNAAVSRLR